MSVYTRTGDTGETSLFGGKRVSKHTPVIEAFGGIDELNSYLGLLIALIKTIEVQNFFQEIQSDLFVIGSVLSGSKGDMTFISPRVTAMEERMDIMEKKLPALHAFILPGGSMVGAHIHVARSICRRVERSVVLLLSLEDKDAVDTVVIQHIIKYLNRLSDFLFVLGRFINKEEHAVEYTWNKRG